MLHVSKKAFFNLIINNVKRFIVIILTGISLTTISAETIFLKNGTTIIGRIQYQDRENVTVATAEGTKTFKKTQIRRISFDDESPDDIPDKPALDPKQVEEILRKRGIEERGFNEKSRNKKTTKPSDTNDMKVSRWEYTWRSAVIPGWGHIYGRRFLVGGGYTLLFIGATSYAAGRVSATYSAENAYKKEVNNFYVMRGNFLDARSDYNTFLFYSLTAAKSKGATYSSSVDSANIALFLLASVYFIQLGHAYWYGYQEEKKWEEGEFTLIPSQLALLAAEKHLSSVPNREILQIGYTFYY